MNKIVGMVAALLAAGAVAGGVAACDAQPSQNGPEYVGICVDPNSGMRVPDQNCGGENALGAALVAAYTWDYIDTYRYPNYVIPAYNSRVNIANITVVHTLPWGTTSVTRSAPRTGGSASSIRTSVGRSSAGSSGSGGRSSSGTSGGRSGSSITRGGFGVPSGSRSGGGRR